MLAILAAGSVGDTVDQAQIAPRARCSLLSPPGLLRYSRSSPNRTQGQVFATLAAGSIAIGQEERYRSGLEMAGPGNGRVLEWPGAGNGRVLEWPGAEEIVELGKRRRRSPRLACVGNLR